MTRIVCLLVGLFVVAGSPLGVAAQGLMDGAGFPGGSLLASIPGVGSFDVGGMRLMPRVRIGYQKIGLNFSLPVPNAIVAVGNGLAGIDLQLTDANVWVGAVGLEGRVSPRLSLFLNAEANAKRNAGAITSDEPVQQNTIGLAFPQPIPYQWTASQLEWWELEAGATYAISNDVAIVAGLRREHLSFRLIDPRSAAGEPANQQLYFPDFSRYTTDNLMDFRLKLWVPYVGIQFRGESYRARLNWSPFLGAAVKLPDRFIINDFILSVPRITYLTDIEWKYSMSRTGTLLEGDFEYDVAFSPNVAVKVWAKGSWLKVRGAGNLDQLLAQFAALEGIPFPQPEVSASSSNAATLARYVTAVGLAAELAF